jgi:predicted O-methyltransferase YrrM
MSTRTLGLSDPLHRWLLDHAIHEPPILSALRAETAELPLARMQISPEQGRFMAWIVQTIGARRVLEIGTFTGYSSIAMALAMPDDAQILCCDTSEEWTQVARRYWAESGVSERISLHLAPASETLADLLGGGHGGTFDFVFIDADKANYLHYYERSLELLRPGGIVAMDNALWSGRVADPSDNDIDTVALRAVTDRVTTDPRVHASLVPIGDGLLLATKR